MGIIQEEEVNERLIRLVGQVRFDHVSEELSVLEVGEKVELVGYVLIVFLELFFRRHRAPFCQEIPFIKTRVRTDQLEHLEECLDILDQTEFRGGEIFNLALFALRDLVGDSIIQVHLVRLFRLSESDRGDFLSLGFEGPRLDDTVLRVFYNQKKSSVALRVWELKAHQPILVWQNVVRPPAFLAEESVQVINIVYCASGSSNHWQRKNLSRLGQFLLACLEVSFSFQLFLVLLCLPHEVSLQKTGWFVESVPHESVLSLSLQHVLDLVAQPFL